MFVVVEFNQASHQPSIPIGADVHDRIEDARDQREYLQAETDQIGRRERFVVYELVEIEEDNDD